jgi:hypothetical protein
MDGFIAAGQPNPSACRCAPLVSRPAIALYGYEVVLMSRTYGGFSAERRREMGGIRNSDQLPTMHAPRQPAPSIV